MLNWLKDIVYKVALLLEKKSIRVQDLPFDPDTTSLPNGVVIEHNRKQATPQAQKKQLDTLDYRMPFGKYRGERICEIKDVQYLKWFVKLRNISKSLRKAVYDRLDYIQMTNESYYASIDSSVYAKTHKERYCGKRYKRNKKDFKTS